MIAERTGCRVIADFRARDLAAGGEGAPLAPFFHFQAMSHPAEARGVLNLGGIANLTFVPKGAAKPKDEPVVELVDAESAHHKVPVLRDGTAAFRYAVTLTHDPEALLGTDETPHAFPGGAFWTVSHVTELR